MIGHVDPRSEPRSQGPVSCRAASYDYDVCIIEGHDIGGTCVNRGCVPSKALLAASGRIREMKNTMHLNHMGIRLDGEVSYDRQGVADHASNLASTIQGNLKNSLVALGVDILTGVGKFEDNHTI